MGNGTYTVLNNLGQNVYTFIFDGYSGSSTLVSDYNACTGLNTSQAFAKSPNGSAVFYTVSQWKSLGYDAHSVFTSSTLANLDGTLTDGSAAIGAGTNLYALGIVTDFAGTPLPTSGAWTAGAYYRAGSAPLRVGKLWLRKH